jgi:hypothetical protein
MGRECSTQGIDRNTYRVSVEKLESMMRWAGKVARTGVERSTYRVSVEKLEERMRWARNVARKGVERNTRRGFVALCLAATL